MDKTVSVTVDNTVQYLQLFNGIFGLTDMELRVLAAFIDTHKKLVDSGVEINPFATELKKQVAKKLGKDNFNTLNNFIKHLHDKGAIKSVEEGYVFHPFLKPKDEDRIVIRLLHKRND